MLRMIERETQLILERHYLTKPKFPAIDFHTHFGNLFGSMVRSDDYLNLYDTKEVIEKIQSYGIKRVVNLDGGWGEEYLRMQEKLSEAGDFIIHFGQLPVERFEEKDFEGFIYKTIRELHNNGVKGLKFWKIIGLAIRDKTGAYLRPDDERLRCIWQTAAEFDMPVLFHIADMIAFFLPLDEKNEYRETLEENPEWIYDDPGLYSFAQLLQMQENLLEQNPDTIFIIPHVGGNAENLRQVSQWLNRFPNMYVDIADRLSELGRQPYSSKDFFEVHAGRILLGTDLLPNDIERYPIYFRFLETKDEYFSYRTDNGVFLGDWHIYGIGLSDDVLKKVYYENAESLLKIR